MSWTGRLSKADVGTGAWVLETDDGERITLYGEVPSTLEGQRVSVNGREVDGMGFAMLGGKQVEVQGVKKA